MPQELHVLRCYACKTFQVQIVKKVPKWQCKVCHEKQSVLKVYAQGSGKDCRQYVQDLNLQQGLLDAQVTVSEINCNAFQQTSSYSNNAAHSGSQSNASKWSEYLEAEDKTYEDVSTSNQDLIDSSLKSFQVRKSNSKGNSMQQQKVTKWSNHVNEKESHFDVALKQHEIESIEEYGVKSKKRKFSESCNSSDNSDGDEGSPVNQRFEGTFPQNHVTGPHKNDRQNDLKSEDVLDQNFMKKSKSKWSHYVEPVAETSTLTCTFSETEHSSKRPVPTDARKYHRRIPSCDAKLQCSSQNAPSSRAFSFEGNSCGNTNSQDKVAVGTSISSVNPFCTTSDDNLDSVLDF